jgi:hypothetical protein
MTKMLIVTGLLLSTAMPSLAQDLVIYGGTSLAFDIEPDGAGSDNTTSLSAYIELEKGSLYGGLSGTVENDTASNEVYLYAGYRNELDSGLSYSAVYTRYFYPNDTGSDYGEIALSLGQPLGDKIGVSLDLYYDHTFKLASAYVGAEFYATDKITLSANYGVFENDGAPNEQEWDLGVTYGLTDEAAVDLRYYDGSDYTEGYFGLELTFDTTILGG